MRKNYFKTALRNLLRNKVYSFINITGLCLGLACAMLIMLYVNDEVSYDRFHKNAKRIYRIDKQNIKNDGMVSTGSYTGYFPGPRFTSNIPEIQTYVRYQPTQVDIKVGANIQSQPANLVDPNFFSVFSFPLISGDPKTLLTQPNSIVITEEVSKKFFGNSDAIGKTISTNLNGSFEPFVVTGVAKNCLQNSSIKFQVLLPLKVSVADQNTNSNWFNSFLTTFVVLNPDVNLKSVQRKMDKVFRAEASESIREITSKYNIKDIGISYVLEPLASIHMGKMVPDGDEILSDKSSPVFSYILSAIALIILLIACINFVNLTVARSVKRAKEIGIRKVIGGSRSQLMIQFLSESFILCFIAFSFAIFIVAAVLPIFNDLSNKALSLSLLTDPQLLMAYVLLFLLTGLLAGFYPAAILSNYNPVQTLYSRFSMTGKNYFQKSLVVFQFALASFLIIGTFAIFLQLNYLTTQSLGYDDTNLLTVEKPGMTVNEGALFRQALIRNPDIIDVALKNSGDNNNTVKVNADKQINVSVQAIDASYLPLLRIPVIAGRNFSPDFPADSTRSILVNEAFVSQAGWQNAIGKQVSGFENNEVYLVAGVVKDYHYKPLTERIGPQIFLMNPSYRYGMTYIKIKAGTETGSLRYIARTYASLFPLNSFTYNFKDQQNAGSYKSEARWKQILLLSAILTVFISCIGLFGLSVLSAEKRTKEIGIRKVLGASVTSIVSILSADFLKLIIIALFISMPLAWIIVNKWLQNYPYRINPEWWLFASAGILVILVALTSISFQSIRAAIANPVKCLRTE